MSDVIKNRGVARWLLALPALGFLLVPGHRNLPLSGIPISDLWFFVALLAWAFIFIALPWKPLRLRAAWPRVATLGVLCVVKFVAGAADGNHGLTATYTAIVHPPAAKARMFPDKNPDGRACVTRTRIDRKLDFLDNSFRPFRRSFNLTMLNARPLHYLPPEEAAVAEWRVKWRGFVRIEQAGEYNFSAKIADKHGYTVKVAGQAFAAAAFHPLPAGVYPIYIEFHRPAGKPRLKANGIRDEKHEPGMRFQLLWQRKGGSKQHVPWWTLSTDESIAEIGWLWGAAHIATLLAAGVAIGIVAIRRVAWDKLSTRRQQVRGLLFAFVLVQIGASTVMTIRHTTARPQWNIINSYDDKIYERRTQTFLTHGWTGPEARREGLLHRSPLMEYYLPAMHVLFGGDYGLIAMAQNVLTALVVLAAFGIGRAVFRSPTAGLWAAGAIAIDPAFTEFGRKLLPTTPAIALFVPAIWLIFRTRRAGGWWRAVFAGGVFALAIVARMNLIGALPGALVLLLWRGRRRLPQRLAHVGLLLVAMLAVWMMVPIRQMQLTGRWFWTPSQGPTILLVGNRPNGGRESEALTAYQNDFLDFADRAAPDEHTRELLRTFGKRALGTHNSLHAHWHWDPLPPKDLFRINPLLTRFLTEEFTQRPGRLLQTWTHKLAAFWWVDSEGWHGSHFRPYTLMLAVAVLIILIRPRRGKPAAMFLMIAGICTVLILSYFEERHRSTIIPLIDVMFAGSAAWGVIRLRRAGRARRRGSIDELPTPKPSGR